MTDYFLPLGPCQTSPGGRWWPWCAPPASCWEPPGCRWGRSRARPSCQRPLRPAWRTASSGAEPECLGNCEFCLFLKMIKKTELWEIGLFDHLSKLWAVGVVSSNDSGKKLKKYKLARIYIFSLWNTEISFYILKWWNFFPFTWKSAAEIVSHWSPASSPAKEESKP